MKKVLFVVVTLLVTVLFSASPSFSNPPRLIIEHNGPGSPNTWLVRVSYPRPGIVECIAFGPNNEPLGQAHWEHFPPESGGEIMVPDARWVHTTRCNIQPPTGPGPGPGPMPFMPPGPNTPPGRPPF